MERNSFNVQMLMVSPSSRFNTEPKWRLLCMWKINFPHFKIYTGSQFHSQFTKSTRQMGASATVSVYSLTQAHTHTMQCKNMYSSVQWERHLSILFALAQHARAHASIRIRRNDPISNLIYAIAWLQRYAKRFRYCFACEFLSLSLSLCLDVCSCNS